LENNLEGDSDDKIENNLGHDLEDKGINLEDKKNNMDNCMEATRYEPKAEEDICR